MGEAVYYLKAKFPSGIEAKEAERKFKFFLEESVEAYDYWQNNRGWSPKEFWHEFKHRFPIIAPILRYAPDKVDGDCNNALSGEISFADCEVKNLMEQPLVEGRYLLYHALVWHLANWGRLEQWFKSIGAEEVEWFSDEHIDLFDLFKI